MKLDGVGAGAGAEVDVGEPDVDVLPEDVVPEDVLDPPEVDVVTAEGLPPVCGVADATVPVPDGSVADVVVPPEPPPPHAERTAAPKIAASPVRTR